MKKMMCMLMLCAMLLSLTACAPGASGTAQETAAPTVQQEPVLEDAPELTVSWGDISITLTTGNYSWNAPDAYGAMSAKIACGTSPLQAVPESEYHVVTEEFVKLSFPVQPDEIIVTRLSSRHSAKGGKGDVVAVTDGLLPVEEGQWIYEIKAIWNRDTWNGEATYQLCISR